MVDKQWANLAVEVSRRVLHTLRKCADYVYDDATLKARYTIDQAIEAARQIAALLVERKTRDGISFVAAIETGPSALQALAEFAANKDVAGWAVHTAGTISDAAANTFGAGLGVVVLAIVVTRLLPHSWFSRLLQDENVRMLFDKLKP